MSNIQIKINKNIKFKKKFKLKLKKNGFKNKIIKLGSLGVKSASDRFLTLNEVEAIRRKITRKTLRLFRVKICIKFNLPISKKSQNSRLGRGVGNIHTWLSFICKGVIILEMFYIQTSLRICIWIHHFLKKNISIKIAVILREIYRV